jgi:hypothetical protein
MKTMVLRRGRKPKAAAFKPEKGKIIKSDFKVKRGKKPNFYDEEPVEKEQPKKRGRKPRPEIEKIQTKPGMKRFTLYLWERLESSGGTMDLKATSDSKAKLWKFARKMMEDVIWPDLTEGEIHDTVGNIVYNIHDSELNKKGSKLKFMFSDKKEKIKDTTTIYEVK